MSRPLPWLERHLGDRYLPALAYLLSSSHSDVRLGLQPREPPVQDKLLRLGPMHHILHIPVLTEGVVKNYGDSWEGALELAKGSKFNRGFTEGDSDSIKWFCFGRLCLRGRKSRQWMCG
ncbi:hypothetical protein B9Z19DRAFT_437192 [Tuber borchii]|uniref:Uncharacterized protein n=1 Tax=Tuber borchii TaxID=42251 RepID=A0A2T6ZGA5_TUBBO|nr:hypothetical protein B9Z19DRAFT_437192 [Tuber borchii]